MDIHNVQSRISLLWGGDGRMDIHNVQSRISLLWGGDGRMDIHNVQSRISLLWGGDGRMDIHNVQSSLLWGGDGRIFTMSSQGSAYYGEGMGGYLHCPVKDQPIMGRGWEDIYTVQSRISPLWGKDRGCSHHPADMKLNLNRKSAEPPYKLHKSGE